MKKIVGPILPMLGFHIICCTFLIGILITTGLLYNLSWEGENKTFFIPALLTAGGLFWAYKRQAKCCTESPFDTRSKVLMYLFYILFSVFLGFIFIIYFFIPWWIPGYRGGILLP